MRKYISALVIAGALMLPAVQPANAFCLLCGAVGYALGSSNGDQYSAAGGNVIYVAPRISERLADPLEVRLITSEKYLITQGPTLARLFAITVDNPEDYVILEVMRVVDPSNARRAVFWFAYIENEKIKPLGALPPPSN